MRPPSFSVLIPDGESDFALFVLHGFIGYPQIKVYVLSNRRWAPARFSRYCHRFIQWKGGAGERFEAMAEAVQRYGIDVVLPAEMEWMASHDELRLALAELTAIAPVLDSESFKVANNKWLLVKLMENHGIPTIPTVLCTFNDEFERQVRQLHFPVLLKPVTAWGGEGIRHFDTLPQLLEFLEQCNREKVRDKFMVQSLLEGYVIGLNLLCRKGQVLAYTMQRGFIPNTRAYAAAGAIRFIESAAALEIGQELAAALAHNGVANIDMFYDRQEHQIRILEVNARFWGSLRGSYVAGVSFPYLACLAALDLPLPDPGYRLARYVHPKTVLREGILSRPGRSSQERFGLEETGLRYVLADPVAETLRGLGQELSNWWHPLKGGD
jgi:predicted ATP-grasp superfamily ATP-dependent carboligase